MVWVSVWFRGWDLAWCWFVGLGLVLGLGLGLELRLRLWPGRWLVVSRRVASGLELILESGIGLGL